MRGKRVGVTLQENRRERIDSGNDASLPNPFMEGMKLPVPDFIVCRNAATTVPGQHGRKVSALAASRLRFESSSSCYL